MRPNDALQRITLYRCGEYPPPVFTGEVYGQITAFYAKSNIHTPPYSEGTQWSGRSAVIDFRYPGGDWVEVARLDFLSSAVPYKIDCLGLMGDTKPFYLQKGSEFAVRMIGEALTAPQTVNFYGSCVEERYASDSVDTFLDLVDTPNAYAAGYLLQSGASGIEFAPLEQVVQSFSAPALRLVDLLDVPPPSPNTVLTVNSNNLIEWASLVGGGGSVLEENLQTANYTLQASDNGKFVAVNASSAVTITVPTGLTVGTQVLLGRRGTGTVTVAPATGVTLNGTATPLNLQSQWKGVVTLWCYASNSWWVFGGV
ncbi:hypothetical protein [Thermosynechococcus sp. FA-CM-4201]